MPDFPSQNVLTGWHSAIKAIKQAPLVKTKPIIKPNRKFLSHLYCLNRSIKNEMEILTKQIIMVERMYMTKAHFMIFSSWSTCKEYWCLPKPAWTSMMITTVSATSNNYFSGRQRWLARNSGLNHQGTRTAEIPMKKSSNPSWRFDDRNHSLKQVVKTAIGPSVAAIARKPGALFRSSSCRDRSCCITDANKMVRIQSEGDLCKLE